ncbi:hypothetical protein MRX96_015554 [Rhipicephalus microplus]
MTVPGPSSMDTLTQRDFQPILDRSSGRMAITVAGTSIDETPDGIAGWVATTQRGKKTSGSAETPLPVSAPTPDKRAAQPIRAEIINRVNANFAKTTRMPFVPRSEYKIVVRPRGGLLDAKMMQLESTIKQMQESMRQQQKTIRKQAEMITRLTSQQPRSGMQWIISAPPTATLTLSDATAMHRRHHRRRKGRTRPPRRKKARRSSVNESDKEEDLNMDNDADETASVSSISTQLSRTTEGQEGLNCGAIFKKIYNRLNRQDRRINKISQKVDNVASAMTKFLARVEARITTGFKEMKLFMVQLFKEELSSLSLGNRNTPGSSLNHGQSN